MTPPMSRMRGIGAPLITMSTVSFGLLGGRAKRHLVSAQSPNRVVHRLSASAGVGGIEESPDRWSGCIGGSPDRLEQLRLFVQTGVLHAAEAGVRDDAYRGGSASLSRSSGQHVTAGGRSETPEATNLHSYDGHPQRRY